VRVSATDWLPDRESWTVDDSVRLADRLADVGADLIDVSGGGIHPESRPDYAGPNYQVALAEQVRAETDLPAVGAVGAITTPEQAEALVRNGRADVAVIGRKLLEDPYFPHRAAASLYDAEPDVPPQYRRGF